MTKYEIIQGLKFTIDMFLFNPSTGETYEEPRNDLDKITIDACRGAIELLEEPRKDEIILTKKEYGELVSSEFDNGYAKGFEEALEQQKTGHWIKTGDMLTNNKGHIIHQVICSECSGIAYFRKGCGKYIGATVCSNCGAKMESEGI